MKKVAILVILMTFVMAEVSEACGSHGCNAPWAHFGPMAVNPAGRGYSGFGRYPLVPFFTPLRPWGGLTPVRQFLFGRGRIRRMARRSFLFGCGGRCF